LGTPGVWCRPYHHHHSSFIVITTTIIIIIITIMQIGVGKGIAALLHCTAAYVVACGIAGFPRLQTKPHKANQNQLGLSTSYGYDDYHHHHHHQSFDQLLVG